MVHPECGVEQHKSQNLEEQKKNKLAPAGNRTRVCTVAGYYSTTRPLVLLENSFKLSRHQKNLNRSAYTLKKSGQTMLHH
jgi:hypothetical protein